MNIFCFPYAGGSSFIYSQLKMKFQDRKELKIIPMEYPGHGVRMGEELSDSVEFIVDDMYKQIQKKDDGSDFAILGYSLGSKLSYLLYRKYKNISMFRRLKCLFFCAMTMDDGKEKKDYSKISDQELMDYTISLGGSSIDTEEDYNNFLQFLPIIRNDFILFEKSKEIIDSMDTELIKKPTFVMYSSDENNIKSFDKYFSNVKDYKFFENGHFFINYNTEGMVRYIISCIENN